MPLVITLLKMESKKSHPLAICSFVFALLPLINIVSIWFVDFAFILLFSPIFILISFITGVMALFKISDYPEKFEGKVFAIIGIVISVIEFLLIVLVIGFLILVSSKLK